MTHIYYTTVKFRPNSGQLRRSWPRRGPSEMAEAWHVRNVAADVEHSEVMETVAAAVAGVAATPRPFEQPEAEVPVHSPPTLPWSMPCSTFFA